MYLPFSGIFCKMIVVCNKINDIWHGGREMSQAKVDRYKAEKANRAKTMKRDKMKKRCIKAAGVLACAVVVVWIGFSAWNIVDSKVSTYELNTTELDNYLSSMHDHEGHDE